MSSTPTTPRVVYRLLGADDWQRAQASGSFLGTEHDLRDGFIHFSTAEQLAETAARHYAGRAGLLLLGVNVELLGSSLRWEPSRGGALFPHLYAALPLSAVTRVEPLPLSADGRHLFPDGLE
jgi:uncharacterized protein (DUF952 family)